MFDGQMVRLRGVRASDQEIFREHLLDAAALNLDAPYDWHMGTSDGDAYIADESTFEADDIYPFSVVSLDDGRLLGRAVLWALPLPHRNATFGIHLFAAERGQGAGTDAVRVLQRFAFDALGLHRLGLTVRAGNPARHLYARLGFTREVVWREDLWVDGEFDDQWVMGLLEDEYRALRTGS